MTDDLDIRINTTNDLGPRIADFIRHAHDREFGDDSMIYAVPEWYMLGHLDGMPVAQIGILPRTITINQKPLLVAGASFLVTEPEYRGRGFATVIMNEAVSFVRDKLELPCVLLTCKPRLESLYSGMGWRTVSEPNIFLQPTGSRSCGGLIMIYECGRTPWPDGRIDFCGLPW